MSPVFQAIEELGDFIDEKMPEETIDAMVKDRGYYVDIINREFWDEELDEASMPE